MASELLGRIEEWRRKLLDLTNRNQLVNCKIGPRAALRLEYPSRDHVWSGLLSGADLTFAWKRELVPDASEDGDDNSESPQLSLFVSKLEGSPPFEPRITLEQCLKSRALSPNHLLTELQDRPLGNRLNRMSLNARTALSEQGVNVLFVAFGFLKWFEADHSDEPRLSPLLLVPVSLERIGATAPWKLSLYEDEITPNFCLRELMKRDFRLQLPEVDPQALLDNEQSRERYESAVQDAVRNESGWEVLSDAVLGQFSFQKLAMYDDYGRHATEIAEHEHCRRIAGEDSTPPPLTVAIPKPERFDAEVHPSKMHTILPCDSSQLEAILAIKAGASLVLDGPPGTGKSQTIANVIAECLADGKTVLFVSEKAAALEVVKQRLDDRNLGDFALNCHSHKASKKEIVIELGRCLNLPCEEYASRDGDLERLYRQRERLNSYVRALHMPHPRLGTSVFDIHGRVAALGNGAVSRCDIPNVLQMDSATLREIIDRLRMLTDCRRVIEEFNHHPWRGCLQTSFSLAFEDEAGDRLGRLSEHLTRLDQQLKPLTTSGLLAAAATVAEVERGLKNVGKLIHAPSIPASWLNGHSRAVTDAVLCIAEWSSGFRSARQECNEFVDKAVDDGWLLQEGGMVGSIDDNWSSGLRPHSATTVRQLHGHFTSLSSDLQYLANLSNEVDQAGIAVLDALKIPTGDIKIAAEWLLIDIGPNPRTSESLSRMSLSAAKSKTLSATLFAMLTIEDAVNAAQAELERHFVSAAFGKLGREVAAKVQKLRRIWKATFPKWRLMRKKVESLYRDNSLRRPSELLHDVGQLRTFLADSDQLAREINGYEESLVRDENGHICWNAVRNGIQSAERLQTLIRVPKELIDAICAKDRVDRPSLALACGRLTTALSTAVPSEQAELSGELGRSETFVFHPRNTAKLYALHERLDSLSHHISRLVRLNTEARLAAEQLASVLSVAVVDWPIHRVKVVVEVARLNAMVRSFQRAWFDDIQREEWRKLVNRLSAVDRDLMARRRELETRMKPIIFGPEGRDAAKRLLPFRRLWKKWLPRWRTASKQMQSLYCDSLPRSRAALLRDALEVSRWHADSLTFGEECRAIQSSVVRDTDQNIRWSAVLDGIRAVELLQDVDCMSAAVIESICGNESQPRNLLCSATSRLEGALKEAWPGIEEVGHVLSVSVVDLPLNHIRAMAEAGRLISQVGVFRRDWFEDAKWQTLHDTAKRLSASDHELTKKREALKARFLPIAFTREGRDVALLVMSFRSFWASFLPKWKMVRGQMESLYQDLTPKTRRTLLRDASELSSFHAENERFDDECRAIESAFVHDGEQNVCWQGVLDGLHAVKLLRDADCISPALIDALCSTETSIRDHLRSATSRFGTAIAAAEQASGEIGSVLSAKLEDWSLTQLKVVVEFGSILARVGIFSRDWFDCARRQELPEVVKRLSATDLDLTKRREAMRYRFKPITFRSEGSDFSENLLPFRRFWRRWLRKWKVVRKQSESFYHENISPKLATLFRDANEFSRLDAAHSLFQDECRNIEAAIIHDGERGILWQAMLDGIHAVELLKEIGGLSPGVIESLCSSGSGACDVLHFAGTRLGDAIRTFELELQGVQQLLENDDIFGDDVHAWRSALKCNQTTSLANIHPALSALSRVFQQATQWSGKLREATESFRQALTVPIQDPPVGLLTKLIEIGKVILETDAFCPVWFEPEKVRGLHEVIPRIEVADKQLAARRRELEERFGYNAFGVKGQQLTARYEEIEGTWQSLFPPLRSLRRQARRLYRGEVPRNSKMFFQAIRQLSLHHRYSAMLVDERRVFDDAYVRDEDGTASLQSVVEAIDAVRSLQASRSIRESVCDRYRFGHQIDLTVFVAARERLETLLSAFELQFSAVRQRFECSDLGNSAAAHQKATASAYADQLREIATGLTDHAERLELVIGLLRDESDVPIDELAGKIKTLKKVRDLRDRVRRHHSEIETVVGKDETPERRDWNESAEKARFLKNLLDEHRDEIPEIVANVLVESEHRSQTTAAYDATCELLSGRFRSDLDFLRRLFPHTEAISSGLVVCQSSLSALSEWLRFLVRQLSQLHDWITYRQTEAELTRLGVREVLHELIAGAYSVEEVEAAFLARLYRLWLDEAYRADPALSGFRVEDHERIIQEFRTLDRLAIQSGTRQIRAKLLNDPERPHAAVFGAPSTSEFGILSREVNKKKRHLPLRQLFARVPNLLVRLKPCLMMSPLAVSTYLESPEFKFDVVIFDEASQVLPWDAIGAVYRGRQLVVAGDQKQLPPSTFFDRMVNNDDDSEDADDLGDFESVLDVLCSIGLPRKRLRWHYRSRREPLIAFSNHHFYDDDLVTFPSPDDLDGATAVRFVHVPNGRWRSKAGFNPIEAKRTAELVLEHIQKYGSRSLGVITFNLRQQLAVLDELTELRQKRPDIEPFFREDRHEPFFVKNLENVQGDERDRIILSVAYGLNEETGRDSMGFGPLNRAGGERRLNVAVTRAREAITLVSSIDSSYIDLNRTKSQGARLLRAYLDYAEHGPAALASKSVETGGQFESPFEEAVANALKEIGLDVRSQIGCGGFRIDLAIVHPEHPGRYVLGIECDGATYHRTATARDRDRMRQEVLEELGWRGRLIRIWSTDWIRNPSRQVERMADAFREALLLPVTLPVTVPDVMTMSPDTAPTLRIRDFRDDKPTARFADIEDISESEIARVLLRLSVTFGVTPKEDLIKSTAREFGFERTGKRISARIESVIQNLVGQDRLRDAGDDRIGASI